METTSETTEATTAEWGDLGAEDTGDLGTVCDDGGGGNTLRRHVKIAELHLSAGFDGSFHYTWNAERKRELKTQVAVSYGGQPFEAGGWRLEAQDRGAADSVPGRPDFHRLIWAEYRYRRTIDCPYPDYDYMHDNCTRRWVPWRFIGNIYQGTRTIRQGLFDAEHGFVQSNGVPWDKFSGRNKTYGGGVKIGPVSLSSQAGFSGITRARYVPIRCEQNWIVGGHGARPLGRTRDLDVDVLSASKLTLLVLAALLAAACSGEERGAQATRGAHVADRTPVRGDSLEDHARTRLEVTRKRPFAPGQRFTLMMVAARNVSRSPLTIRRIELIGVRGSPGVARLETITLAPRPSPPPVPLGLYQSYPPATNLGATTEECVIQNVVPAAGYVLRPSRNPDERALLVIRIRATGAGTFWFRGQRVIYEQGGRLYREDIPFEVKVAVKQGRPRSVDPYERGCL